MTSRGEEPRLFFTGGFSREEYVDLAAMGSNDQPACLRVVLSGMADEAGRERGADDLADGIARRARTFS